MTTIERFSTREEIKELVPPGLLIPADRLDLRVPQEAEHTNATTTPREVGYVFYSGRLALFPVERSILDLKEDEGGSTLELFTGGWGNHVGRAVMRAVLEPDRLAPISMVHVYENELLLARCSDPGERSFFEQFIENFGILLRK